MELIIFGTILLILFVIDRICNYRLFLRIQDTLHDIKAAGRAMSNSSGRNCSNTQKIEANFRYLIEYWETRLGQSDELRRQQLLQEVRRRKISEETTPIESLIVTPHTPVPPPWIGDQAMQIMRATRRHK